MPEYGLKRLDAVPMNQPTLHSRRTLTRQRIALHATALLIVAAMAGCTIFDAIFGPLPNNSNSNTDLSLGIAIVQPAEAVSATPGVATIIQWADIATIGLDPGYDGLLAAGGGNALEDRPAFSGTSAGFPERSTLTLDFGDRFAGQTVQLRFRVASDIFVGAAGWFIDDLDVSGIDNTPFADFIEEPSTCSLATAAAKVQAGIGEVRVAPRASLAAFDRRDLLDEDPQQAPQ